MKKLILVLSIAIVLVAAVVINNAVASKGTNIFCYGTVTYGLHAPYQPAEGAMITCTENGWNGVSGPDGGFFIGGLTTPGTYHIVATKGVWQSVSVSFYYNGSQLGTNVGSINMRPVN